MSRPLAWPSCDDVAPIARLESGVRLPRTPLPPLGRHLVLVRRPRRSVVRAFVVVLFVTPANRLSTRWPVPSRRPVSRREAKRPASSWPRRPPVNRPPAPGASRNRIVTVPVPWPFVRSGATKSPPSCSSASCLSNVSSEKSHRISRPICVSSRPPSEPYRYSHGRHFISSFFHMRFYYCDGFVLPRTSSSYRAPPHHFSFSHYSGRDSLTLFVRPFSRFPSIFRIVNK